MNPFWHEKIQSWAVIKHSVNNLHSWEERETIMSTSELGNHLTILIYITKQYAAEQIRMVEFSNSKMAIVGDRKDARVEKWAVRAFFAWFSIRLWPKLSNESGKTGRRTKWNWKTTTANRIALIRIVCLCVCGMYAQALNFRFILPLENFIILNSNNNNNRIKAKIDVCGCVYESVKETRVNVNRVQACLCFSSSFFYSTSHLLRWLSAKITITRRFYVNNCVRVNIFAIFL